MPSQLRLASSFWRSYKRPRTWSYQHRRCQNIPYYSGTKSSHSTNGMPRDWHKSPAWGRTRSPAACPE